MRADVSECICSFQRWLQFGWWHAWYKTQLCQIKPSRHHPCMLHGVDYLKNRGSKSAVFTMPGTLACTCTSPRSGSAAACRRCNVFFFNLLTKQRRPRLATCKGCRADVFIRCHAKHRAHHSSQVAPLARKSSSTPCTQVKYFGAAQYFQPGEGARGTGPTCLTGAWLRNTGRTTRAK